MYGDESVARRVAFLDWEWSTRLPDLATEGSAAQHHLQVQPLPNILIVTHVQDTNGHRLLHQTCMTSPSVCSRRNIAAFCNVCKYALPRSQRFIHSLAPLQAKTAPAVRRKARQDAPVAWFIADRLGPSEDPLSDVEVQKLIAQLQVNMPHVLGAYEYVLRRSMDRPMIHRIMLFDERILPILGRELAWSEDVQKIFDSYRKCTSDFS